MKIKKWGVYWIDLKGVNHYSKGARPCLIISDNKINSTSDCITIIPLKTYRNNRLYENYDMVFNIKGVKNVSSYLSINNIYTIDKNKVGDYIGYMELNDTKNVKHLFKNTIMKG